MIIPWDLFVFYSAPYDPSRPWAKQNYKKDLDENIQFYYESDPSNKNRFFLYEESWYWYDTSNLNHPIKHYRTFLKGIYHSEETCQFWIKFYKNFYLEHPEMIYQERWINHDLH